MTSILAALAGVAFVGLLGYLAACAAAERWLTFREWWGSKTCRHEWKPVHHSYRCTRCGKLDKEF
jgi:hypothetical protein